MKRPPELQRDEPLVWSPGRGTDVWAMFQAARAGDVGAIDRLLAADPDLARCHFEYHHPLGFAVRAGHVEAAARLADAHPVLLPDAVEAARDRDDGPMAAMLEGKLATLGVSSGGEAVAAAIRGRDAPRVRELLDEEPGRVHAADLRTNRPIHWAVMTRQPDLIDALLERGADPEARRVDGARPVQLVHGDYHYRGWRDVPEDTAPTPREVLDHLRSRGVPADICTAAWMGDADRVRELLRDDPSLANRSSDYITWYPCSGTPLRNAAGAGHRDVVELLLDAGADPNLPEEHIAPRGHALYAAVANGHDGIARLLLERGAHPNVEVESSADTLSRALLNDDRPMVRLLCSYGAARRLSLLAYYGDVATAAAVLDRDPALADDPEALRHAAAEGHEAFVRLLLRHAPDLPGRVSAPGKTPELTRLLFDRGMDPDHRSWLGVTALHRLAERGDLDNARVYLDRGADLHAREELDDSTPLAWAARAGRTDMVRLLLERGASPALPDDPPWATPLAWALRRGHEEVVSLLRSSGTGPAI